MKVLFNPRDLLKLDSTPAPDYTDRYNTNLSPAEEAAYQTWAKKNRREKDTFDYDMRGAWKARIEASDNGHFPDTYKKPNHPTFSNESQYHGVDGEQGGSWNGEVFTPGPTNDKYWRGTALEEYISRHGDGASLKRR